MRDHRYRRSVEEPQNNINSPETSVYNGGETQEYCLWGNLQIKKITVDMFSVTINYRLRV